MNTKGTSSSRQAFTAVDLLIVVATLVVVAGVLVPRMAGSKCRGRTHVNCVNNLKQIGIGFRLWAADGEPYPKYNPTNEVWQYYQIVGREIGSPKILVCPGDTLLNNRSPALDFETPATLTPNNLAHPSRQNKALSYFHSPDASEDEPGTILGGDRSISTNATAISGVIVAKTSTPVQWIQPPHEGAGNILFADGSAYQVTTSRLRDHIRANTNITQRFLVP